MAKTNNILRSGVALLVIGGGCAILLYRLQSAQGPGYALQPFVSPSKLPVPELSIPPPPLRERESISTETVSASTEDDPVIQQPTPNAVAPEWSTLRSNEMFRSITRSYRKQLDTLPSWLPIQEFQKDELAELAASQQDVGFNANPDEELLALKREWEQFRKAAPERTKQLLSASIHALWKEYQETAPARLQLARLNSQLGDHALPEAQTRTLAAVLTRASMQAQEEARLKYGDADERSSASERINIREEILRRTLELQRQMAADRLSSDQLKAYELVLLKERMSNEENIARQRIFVESGTQ